MPDLSNIGVASLVLLVSLTVLTLIVSYLVIFLAVRNAMRSHARWMFEHGPEQEARDREWARNPTPGAR